MKTPVSWKEYTPDKRPDASGRQKPRPGSTGPNGVANRFLAGLRGQRVKLWSFSDQTDSALHGVLKEFDSYSLVITVDDVDKCIWKGPGLVVEPDNDLQKGE